MKINIYIYIYNKKILKIKNYYFKFFFYLKGFRTIVFIFIVISTTFRLICPPAESWRIRCLKESSHMLGYNDMLSRPSIELNTYGNR